jgi:hypothetical protein
MYLSTLYLDNSQTLDSSFSPYRQHMRSAKRLTTVQSQPYAQIVLVSKTTYYVHQQLVDA